MTTARGGDTARRHPDAAAIAALGGPRLVAALCGIDASTVRYWRMRGISGGYRLYLATLAPHLLGPVPPVPAKLAARLFGARLAAAVRTADNAPQGPTP